MKLENKEEFTVEESFEKLDELLNRLESKDITLDESFELYKKGMEELKNCSKKIDATKKAVMAISSEGNLVEFEGEE